MAKPDPIKLPHELEEEEKETRLRTIKERIEKDRENNELCVTLLVFLREFEAKVVEFNQFIQSYLPYPTISQTTKDHVRNRLRSVNEFYFSFTGSNPHALICECMTKDTTEALELDALHGRLAILLTRLNNNVACISNKKVLLFHRQTKTYDWT